MRRPLLAAAALAAGAFSGAAFAKAPKPADLPSVEEIYQQAKAVQDGQKNAAQTAKLSPLAAAIAGFRDGSLALDGSKPLTDCIMNAAETPANRQDAASALIERFDKEGAEKNAGPRAQRRTAALAVLDLMKVDKAKDEVGLTIIEKLLFTWYRQAMIDSKFRAGDKPAARAAAYAKMKTFLGKSGN